jgi:hypothetical protein
MLIILVEHLETEMLALEVQAARAAAAGAGLALHHFTLGLVAVVVAKALVLLSAEH